MSITIEVVQKPNYIHLQYEGSFKLTEVLKIFAKAFSFASKDSLTAILLDFRKLNGGPLTVSEHYYISNGLAIDWIELRKTILIAALENEPHIFTERFVETVATNCGSLIRVFYDFDEAVNWLESEMM